MSKLILEPGNYWFFGLPPSSTNKEVLEFEENFIERLPVHNKFGWGWRVGNTLRSASGVFTFKIENPDEFSATLFWDCNVEEVRRTHRFIDHEGILESDKIETTKRIILECKKTTCNESCVFYWSCDGDRNSMVNPSNSLGLPCEYYCYNKELKVE